MVQTLAPPRLTRDIYHTRTNAYPLVFGANQRPVSCTFCPARNAGSLMLVQQGASHPS